MGLFDRDAHSNLYAMGFNVNGTNEVINYCIDAMLEAKTPASVIENWFDRVADLTNEYIWNTMESERLKPYNERINFVESYSSILAKMALYEAAYEISDRIGLTDEEKDEIIEKSYFFYAEDYGIYLPEYGVSDCEYYTQGALEARHEDLYKTVQDFLDSLEYTVPQIKELREYANDEDYAFLDIEGGSLVNHVSPAYLKAFIDKHGIEMSQETVKTNIGEMPKEDYDSIKLHQAGFESQDEVNEEAVAMDVQDALYEVYDWFENSDFELGDDISMLRADAETASREHSPYPFRHKYGEDEFADYKLKSLKDEVLFEVRTSSMSYKDKPLVMSISDNYNKAGEQIAARIQAEGKGEQSKKHDKVDIDR